MALAIFGIDNDGVNLALNLLLLFLVVIYLALVAWVYLDARRRLEDPVLIACATVAALFPFVGPFVYSILRPPELLADQRERELEIRAAQLRVRQLEEASCPNCEHPVERTYLRCPQCRARIKDPCESCGKPVDPRWTLCPYCETPTRRSVAPETSRRRRSESGAPTPGSGSGKRAGSGSAARSGVTRAMKPAVQEPPEPAKRSQAPSAKAATAKRAASAGDGDPPRSTRSSTAKRGSGGSAAGGASSGSASRKGSSRSQRPER